MLVEDKVKDPAEEGVRVILESELTEIDEFMEVIRRYSGRKRQQSVDDVGWIYVHSR